MGGTRIFDVGGSEGARPRAWGATENRNVFMCHRQEKLCSHAAVLTGNAIAITPILHVQFLECFFVPF